MATSSHVTHRIPIDSVQLLTHEMDTTSLDLVDEQPVLSNGVILLCVSVAVYV